MTREEMKKAYNEMLEKVFGENEIFKRLNITKEELEIMAQLEKENPEEYYLPGMAYMIGLYKGLQARAQA